MRNIQLNNNRFQDMPVTEIISIASSVFFMMLLVLSVYLMSIKQYHYGFSSLVAASIYFVASNAAELKLVTTAAWFCVLVCALKGMLGI